MKIQVTPHTIQIIRDTDINAGEYNVSKCTFEFSNEYQELSNVAVFTNCEGTCVEQAITNNECIIPYEMLENPGQVKLGVYGYEVEEETLVLRYSPTAQYFNVKNGSYAEGEQPTPPSPSIVEQLQAQITDNRNDINDLQEDVGNIKEDITELQGDVSNLEQTKADKSEIPTKVSQLDNDSGYIDKNVDDLTNYTPTNELSAVATSGSYNDLEDKPDLSVYSLITETGSKIDLEINSTTYVLNAKLYDKNNNLISTSSGIDLPLESMVVGATYDSVNKQIVLTLQNGQTLNVPVGDLVAGLQSEITSENMLSSDLVDDTNHTHKFVTTQEKESWNNKSDFSGSYNDLTNKPDLSVYEEKSNKVTSINENSTDTQYPSAKCVYDSQEEQDYQIEKAKMVYNALPRVTEEGESVTLEDTAECPMETELGSTELSQDTTTGANLMKFNERTVNNYGIAYKVDEKGQLTITGQCSTSVTLGYNLATNLITLEAGTYVVDKVGNNTDLTVYITVNGTKNTITLPYTFTISETVSDVLLENRVASGTTYNVNCYYTLAKNTATTERYTNGASPNPDYPQEIHSISGDNEIKVIGKNLASGLRTGVYNSRTGVYVVNSSYVCSKEPIYVKSNETYSYSINGNSIKCWAYEYDKDNNYLGYQSNSNGKFTPGNNTYYFNYSFDTGEISNVPLDSKIQIEYGTTVTPYTPYQEQSLPLNLGDLEYCKIGNYKDNFFKAIEGDSIYDSLDSTTKASLTSGMWYLQKKIGKKIFDGTETDLTLQSINAYGIANFKWAHYLKTVNLQVICDKLVKQTTSIAQTTTEGILWQIDDTYIRLDEDKASTVAQLRTWLSNNNLITYYVLATPTYILLNSTLQTELNNIEKAISYQGQTNVSQINNDLPFTLSLSAIRDLSTL